MHSLANVMQQIENMFLRSMRWEILSIPNWQFSSCNDTCNYLRRANNSLNLSDFDVQRCRNRSNSDSWQFMGTWFGGLGINVEWNLFWTERNVSLSYEFSIFIRCKELNQIMKLFIGLDKGMILVICDVDAIVAILFWLSLDDHHRKFQLFKLRSKSRSDEPTFDTESPLKRNKLIGCNLYLYLKCDATDNQERVNLAASFQALQYTQNPFTFPYSCA